MELCNPAAERAVLAGIFTFGADAYFDVADLVNPNTFQIASNQLLYKCFAHIITKDDKAKIDIPTVLAIAKELGFADLAKPKEVEHLRAISNFPLHKENVRVHAGTIKKLEVARNLVGELYLAQEKVREVSGEEKLAEIVALAEKPILEFSNKIYGNQDDEPKQLGEEGEAYLNYLADNPREADGISTGYKRFDASLGGGLMQGGTVIVAARMKVGKSLMRSNIGLYIACKLGIPVLEVDTEMTWKIAYARALAKMTKIEWLDIVTGKFSQDPYKKKRLYDAQKYLKDKPIYYKSLPDRTYDEILAIIRRWIVRKVGLLPNGEAKPCVVIFDWIKLTDSKELKSATEWQLLGLKLSQLNALMIKYNVACLCLAQENRTALEKENSGTLAGSDRLAMFCSALYLLREKSSEELAEQHGNDIIYDMKLIPLLMRHSSKLPPGDYINIRKLGKICTLEEGPTRNELHNLQQKEDTGFDVEDDKHENE